MNAPDQDPFAVPLSVDDYVRGVSAGDRTVLARAITLIESSASAHQDPAQDVLRALLSRTGKAMRVGITGVPGVGKSTFIEALGCLLCSRGLQVAVLTIDPTSPRSGGSILGDKTRMDRLSREPNAYIRPSPSGDSLGGVARKTRETILLCEAAGFDVVLVETVGAGQCEVAVRSMVDFFLLLLLPGGGDELQGIKKGVMELVDGIVVNKAEGENRPAAERARAEYGAALRYLAAATPHWKTDVLLASALKGEGIAEAWSMIERFYGQLGPAGILEAKRRRQTVQWLEDLIHDELLARFQHDPRVAALLAGVRESVARGEITAVCGAERLLEAFDASREGRMKK